MADSDDGKSFREKVEEIRKERQNTGVESSKESIHPVLKKLVSEAKNETVTADRLRGDEQYFHSAIPYLEEGEQPHFLFPLTNGVLADSPLVVEAGAERNELLSKYDGGSVVVTNYQVRVVSSKGEWTIPYNSITSVDFVSHPALHIQTTGRTYYIKIAGHFFDEEQNLSEATDYIRQQQREAKETSNTESSESDPLERIEKLNELKDQGIISESEFDEKKSALLDQI